LRKDFLENIRFNVSSIGYPSAYRSRLEPRGDKSRSKETKEKLNLEKLNRGFCEQFRTMPERWRVVMRDVDRVIERFQSGLDHILGGGECPADQRKLSFMVCKMSVLRS
jgi:hypothetical protein